MNAHAAYPGGTDTRAVLALSASYRHAIMNHLQVVLGWLQLGQPEKAEEYIGILQEGLLGETRLVRAAVPEAGATLILRRGRAEDCGIELVFRVAEGVRSFGWDGPETGRLIAALADASILCLDRSPAGRRLEIVLDEDGAFRRLTLELHEAPVDADVVIGLVQEVLSEGKAGQDARQAFERLAKAGGSWACYQRASAGVISVSWPKLGSPCL